MNQASGQISEEEEGEIHEEPVVVVPPSKKRKRSHSSSPSRCDKSRKGGGWMTLDPDTLRQLKEHEEEEENFDLNDCDENETKRELSPSRDARKRSKTERKIKKEKAPPDVNNASSHEKHHSHRHSHSHSHKHGEGHHTKKTSTSGGPKDDKKHPKLKSASDINNLGDEKRGHRRHRSESPSIKNVDPEMKVSKSQKAKAHRRESKEESHKEASHKQKRSNSTSPSRKEKNGHRHEKGFYGRKEGNHSKSRSRSPSRSGSHRSHSSKGHHYHHRHRSKSRSRLLSNNERIDKEKLLNIARQNLIKMLEKGVQLPKSIDLKRLKLKYLREITTHKQVQQYTEFCRAIAAMEAKHYVDSDTDSDGSDNDDIKSIVSEGPFSVHHPFKLSERREIEFKVRDFNALKARSAVEVQKTLIDSFPVSFGERHRKKELEWKEVDDTPLALTAPPPPPPPANLVKKKIESLLNKPKEQEPAFTLKEVAPSLSNTNTNSQNSETETKKSDPLGSAKEGDEEKASTSAQNMTESKAAPPPPPSGPDGPRPGPDLSSVIAQNPQLENTDAYNPAPMPVDLGTVMAQRLSAMRILTDDPFNVVALKQLHDAQDQMQKWAESKITPGQWGTSSNNVPRQSVAQQDEVQNRVSAWCHVDQLKKAAPVEGGIGMYLLMKMGWRPGEGLGLDSQGTVEPIAPTIKLDTKGLRTEEETPRNLPAQIISIPDESTLPGRNPVSMLNELASKRKWFPPEYEIAESSGPPHRPNFLYKVIVNGVTFQPTITSPNKKQAKALAATVCLQSFGLLPKDDK